MQSGMQDQLNRQLHVKMGLCSINNAPLDFKKNYQRIVQSIEMCRSEDCMIRVGAELEVCGYACGDHFCEYETITHSWDVVRDILRSGVTNGIVCDVGGPVLHKAALYNCRIILFNSKVVAIRPKMIMADGGNYYETRWFSSWREINKIDEFFLPMAIQAETGQTSVPIGIFILNFNDTRLAYEICEESWISRNPMIQAALDGAEIFINPSASDISRGKLKRKIQMITEFTERHGGAYGYVNVKGSSGQRTYFDGGCIFSENGKIRFLSEIQSLDDIVITPVVVNLTFIRAFRLSNKSFQKESNCVNRIPRVSIDVNVATCEDEYYADGPKHQKQIKRLLELYCFPHATYEPSMWIWEYLRKSGSSGFFLPLSGGLDSFSVAVIVYNMCYMVFQEITEKNSQQVLNDLRKILRKPEYMPTSPKEMMSQLLFTVYMGNENSSSETKRRAQKISSALGFNHRAVSFDPVYSSIKSLISESTGVELKFKKDGGSDRTDIGLQNIQARMRMVLAYAYANAQLEAAKKEGFLLVLASANLDEALRGYFTKYDNSSADYNPIASFSKVRLREYLNWNKQLHPEWASLIDEVIDATPTAELKSLSGGKIAQTDEQEMGFTFEELETFGRLRMTENLGPVTMFERLLSLRQFTDVRELARKVKKFFQFYGQNRHKMATITPGFHYNPEGCDDNRFDIRPFIYETDWRQQFMEIDRKLGIFMQMHPNAKSPSKLNRAVSFMKSSKRN